MKAKNNKPNHIAAVDMGSNSFHMVIGHMNQGELRILDKLAEKVQLGAGVASQGTISDIALNTALDCLAKFKQRMAGIPSDNIRIVGTNALRMAKNSSEFIGKAEELLEFPVDIISGVEEARLIYLGVSHVLADDSGRRLVIDIGGGSTEFIVGQRFETRCLESLHLGCVTFKERFFLKGKIKVDQFEQAVLETRRQVATIARPLLKEGWVDAVGASGTMRSILQVLLAQGWSDETITLEGLEKLKTHILAVGRTENIDLEGLKEDRRSIFPSGLAILLGIFYQLNLTEMRYSDGALREGLLYDQLGRIRHEDVRDRTVVALQDRYHLDKQQASNVEKAGMYLLDQVASAWQLEHPMFREMLHRAASLHEIGLAISHSQFHKHGGYLLKHADLAGFSTVEQSVLSALVRSHRRKFPLSIFDELLDTWYEPAQYLAVLLRLAVIFNHSRSESDIHSVKATAFQKRVTLGFNKNWLETRPLTQADLLQEQGYLAKVGFQLRIIVD